MKVIYHGSFLNTGIQLRPADIIRGCELADGHLPPVPPGEAGIGMCVSWGVVDEVLDGLLSE